MKLVHAFENSSWQAWNREIEEDSQSGKLDFLYDEAMIEKTQSAPGFALITSRFWNCLGDSPDFIQCRISPYASNFLSNRPATRIGKFRSEKLEKNYRVLAIRFIDHPAYVSAWVWVGNHKQYRALIR